MSLPYFKMYPRDFFEGTALMPFELKAAYGLILNLIYMHRGKLPDDPRYIAGNLGCSVRKWNSIRKSLIEIGKIKAENEIISNLRADKEEIILRKFQDKQAENRRGTNKNNDLQEPPLNQPEPEPEPYTTTLLDGREKDLNSALGRHYENAASYPALLSMAEPINWLSKGCDFDLDIVPVVKALSSKANRIMTWGYFTEAVYEARDRRLNPAPEPSQPISKKPKSMSIAEMAMRQSNELAEQGR